MSEIELILKSPTDRIAPFTIKCNNSWTIKQLKEHIKIIYPLKPTVESQKVIYVGKLLKDEQILKNLFEPESSTIVHFICQSSINETTEKKADDVSRKLEITPEKCPDLYKEYQNYVSDYYASSSRSSFAAMNQYQQMMWINQAYMQSYASYCAQFSCVPPAQVAPQSSVATVVESSPVAQLNQDPNNDNERRRIDGQAGENNGAGGGVQNMMAAAFGGLMGDGGEDENDGEVEPRDILHYFYILVRFGLLLLICYYYSSVASVVTTLMLFFLFFGVNLIRRNHHNHNQNAAHIIPPVVPPVGAVGGQIDTNQQRDVNRNTTEDIGSSAGGETRGTEGSTTTTTTAAAAAEGDYKNNVPTGTLNENSLAASPPSLESPAPSSPTTPAVAMETLPTITDRLKRAATTSLQFVLTFFVTLFPEPIAQIDIN